MSWQRRLAIVAGGTVGTLGREAIAAALPGRSGWPWATFTVNLLGAFLLGWVLARVLVAARLVRVAIPLLGIGLFGGFTTFGAFVYEIWDLAAGGQPAIAAAYALTSVVVGMAAAVAGSRLAGRI